MGYNAEMSFEEIVEELPKLTTEEKERLRPPDAENQENITDRE